MPVTFTAHDITHNHIGGTGWKINLPALQIRLCKCGVFYTPHNEVDKLIVCFTVKDIIMLGKKLIIAGFTAGNSINAKAEFLLLLLPLCSIPRFCHEKIRSIHIQHHLVRITDDTHIFRGIDVALGELIIYPFVSTGNDDNSYILRQT